MMFFRKKNTEPKQEPQNTSNDVMKVDSQSLINSVQHLAVIMDGNGRWAQKRNLPRVMGHVRGVQTVKQLVKNCIKYEIKSLTLFAFSSENWRRPAEEVNFLMRLFTHTLKREFIKLYQNNISLHLIGDLSVLDESIQKVIQDVFNSQPILTKPILRLNIAINYGGQNDITQAVQAHLISKITSCESLEEALKIIAQLKSTDIANHLALHDQPTPDLMIRTGGEQRISNFLLWQLAYAELYFSDCFWPAFNEEELCNALASYQKRERRFGRTSAQVAKTTE
jgi:undecaprenyl diphosphate synthase